MERRSQLRRTAELPRKRTTPRRRPAARCSYSPRCKGRPSVIVSDTERLCSRHATWTADKLVGDFVRARDHRCILASFAPSISCYHVEALRWCHLIPKGRYGATRYDPANAVAGCDAHHKAFDEAPLEKARWIVRFLGSEEFEALEHRAMHGTKPELGDVIRQYRNTQRCMRCGRTAGRIGDAWCPGGADHDWGVA